MRELSIPPETTSAKRADELLRGWIIDDRLVCSLRPSSFNEPEQWGLLLADALHHVCDALALESSHDKMELKRVMVKSFLAEIREPTGDHWGEFVE